MSLDLSSAEIFQGLSADSLARLAMLGRQRSFALGSALVRRGDPSDCLYVILEGRVRLERAAGDSSPAAAERGAGEVVGEREVLDGCPRSETAVVVEDVRALELRYTSLALVTLQYPEVAAALTRALGGQPRGTGEQRGPTVESPPADQQPDELKPSRW